MAQLVDEAASRTRARRRDGVDIGVETERDLLSAAAATSLDVSPARPRAASSWSDGWAPHGHTRRVRARSIPAAVDRSDEKSRIAGGRIRRRWTTDSAV